MIIQHTVFTVAAAQEIATKLNNDEANEDGWSFLVVVDPLGTGKAVIEVYDEELFKLGLL